MVKNLPTVEKTQIWFLGQEDPMKKRMVTHSSVPAWRIPWTEEPGRLQSMGCKELHTTEWFSQHRKFKKCNVMISYTRRLQSYNHNMLVNTSITSYCMCWEILFCHLADITSLDPFVYWRSEVKWSRSVVSDSLRPCQAPLSMGFSRQEY